VDFDPGIGHVRPVRWQGGLAGLKHNCHLDPKLREVLTTIKSGVAFAKALSASIGEEQLSYFEGAFGLLEKSVTIDGALSIFARRYEEILTHCAECIASAA
jgi:hypothetical protein